MSLQRHSSNTCHFFGLQVAELCLKCLLNQGLHEPCAYLVYVSLKCYLSVTCLIYPIVAVMTMPEDSNVRVYVSEIHFQTL